MLVCVCALFLAAIAEFYLLLFCHHLILFVMCAFIYSQNLTILQIDDLVAEADDLLDEDDEEEDEVVVTAPTPVPAPVAAPAPAPAATSSANVAPKAIEVDDDEDGGDGDDGDLDLEGDEEDW